MDDLLPYSDAAAFGEVYFPGRYPHSFLAAAHEKLRAALRNSFSEMTQASLEGVPVLHTPLKSYAQNAQSLRQEHRPLIIATEDVHKDILLKLIGARL